MKSFKAHPRPCLVLRVTVLEGRHVTLGKWRDWQDTPDPYVELFIPTAPNARKKTKVIDNEPNPKWNETLEFYLDARIENTLKITLKDYDVITRDDQVGETHSFNLGDLPLDMVVPKTFVFSRVASVDIEMIVCRDTATNTSLRYSLELCDDETKYINERRKVVFEAMKEVLGERAPRSLNEVPNVAILGSGGGFRAMTGYGGATVALFDTKILDCAMYMAGLSGSAWFLSLLNSHPEWPDSVTPREILTEMRENVKEDWKWHLFNPAWMYKHTKMLLQKKRRGQPISFTDFFGSLIAGTLLKQRSRQPEPQLSDQRRVITNGQAPLPIYTCLHVKKDTSARKFSEWVEFTPHEIGMAKYGTFMKSELFGNKFFLGKQLTNHPEPALSYLQGVWGSAFTILLQRFLKDQKKQQTGHPQKEQEEVNDEEDGIKAQDDEDSDEEWSGPDTDDEDGEGQKAGAQHDTSLKYRIENNLIQSINFLKTRAGRAAAVHSFLRGLELDFFPGEEIPTAEVALPTTQIKRMYIVDGGLMFNSPYPPLLRPQRDVDVYLSFDFSERKSDLAETPLKELALAEEWARNNGVPFPPINAEKTFKREGMKECYVFKDPADPNCPIIIHIVLVNKTFKDFKKPGILRVTKEEKAAGNFAVFEDPNEPYSSLNFQYSNTAFDHLAQLMEFNTLLSCDIIKDVMAECVLRRRGRNEYGKS